MSGRLDKIMEAAKGMELFYPVVTPQDGGIPGRISGIDADAHYNVEAFRGRSIVTMGPGAYYLASRLVGVARSVVHLGGERLMGVLSELCGFQLNQPGKADIAFYSGPVPSQEALEKLLARNPDAILVETTPETDSSDQIAYELALQKAGLVTGFLGYPGMGFDATTKGRPALFIGRKK